MVISFSELICLNLLVVGFMIFAMWQVESPKIYQLYVLPLQERERIVWVRVRLVLIVWSIFTISIFWVSLGGQLFLLLFPAFLFYFLLLALLMIGYQKKILDRWLFMALTIVMIVFMFGAGYVLITLSSTSF